MHRHLLSITNDMSGLLILYFYFYEFVLRLAMPLFRQSEHILRFFGIYIYISTI